VKATQVRAVVDEPARTVDLAAALAARFDAPVRVATTPTSKAQG